MSIELVLLGLLVACVLAQLVFSWQQGKRLQQLEQSLAASTAAQAAQKELLENASRAVVSLHQGVNALEQRLARTAQRQQDIEARSASQLTYEQAAKLVQMGAAPEDLVKSCGLSQAEAKLVSLMAARGVGQVS
ncbi:MAG TPA: DUF2802 domain-containing protein [Pseudohongiella sp.]|nr:DUF2802 domain-containing protein [Pseudohongiella sp.]